MRKTFIAGAIVGLGALIGVVPATGTQSQNDVERSFDVGSGGTLRIDAAFGNIEIVTTGGSTVEVRVSQEVRDRYESDTAQILSEHQVDVSQSGDDVVVVTEVSRASRDRWREDYNNTPLRVRFEISVPTAYSLDLETAGGNIEVDDLDGELRAETAGGNLELGNIVGTVWGRTAGGNIALEGSSATADLATSGGNITIGDVDGSVDAETSGGSIRISRAGGEVRASTAGGNIDVDEVGGTIEATTRGGNVVARITRQPAGDCRLSTSAGTVRVTLAPGIAVDVDASTSIGGISTDFAVDGSIGRNSIRGSINGGGPELRLRSSAGSIRIREG